MSDILKDFIPQLKELVKSETVFGEPYTVNDVTLIPVNSVKIGFGFGDSGVVKVNSSGGGGGVLLTPVAFIIIKDGMVTLQNLQAGNIENTLEKIPDFIEKLYNIWKKTFDKKEKETE